MTEPDTLEPQTTHDESINDDLPPQRSQGQSDPWHGLDDFEED